MDQPKHISLFVNANSCSGAILSWVYIDIYPHTFIHLIINSNTEMDIINCSHGGLSFLEGIPRITLEKAADGRNGEGEKYITRWLKRWLRSQILSCKKLLWLHWLLYPSSLSTVISSVSVRKQGKRVIQLTENGAEKARNWVNCIF